MLQAKIDRVERLLAQDIAGTRRTEFLWRENGESDDAFEKRRDAIERRAEHNGERLELIGVRWESDG